MQTSCALPRKDAVHMSIHMEERHSSTTNATRHVCSPFFVIARPLRTPRMRHMHLTTQGGVLAWKSGVAGGEEWIQPKLSTTMKSPDRYSTKAGGGQSTSTYSVYGNFNCTCASCPFQNHKSALTIQASQDSQYCFGLIASGLPCKHDFRRRPAGGKNARWTWTIPLGAQEEPAPCSQIRFYRFGQMDEKHSFSLALWKASSPQRGTMSVGSARMWFFGDQQLNARTAWPCLIWSLHEKLGARLGSQGLACFPFRWFDNFLNFVLEGRRCSRFVRMKNHYGGWFRCTCAK